MTPRSQGVGPAPPEPGIGPQRCKSRSSSRRAARSSQRVNTELPPKGEGQITLRKEPGGEEVPIPFIKRLPQLYPPLEELQLVFDVVGNFEPSYTEYVMDYLLGEMWLPVVKDKKQGRRPRSLSIRT